MTSSLTMRVLGPSFHLVSRSTLMKKTKREQQRLNLTRETLRQLENEQLDQAAGGVEISTSMPAYCGVAMA